MYAWSTKPSLFGKKISQIGVTFRDESKEPSATIIGYSDVTVTAPNHPLIMQSKALLVTAHAIVP
jgi:hypothetical protein